MDHWNNITPIFSGWYCKNGLVFYHTYYHTTNSQNNQNEPNRDAILTPPMGSGSLHSAVITTQSADCRDTVTATTVDYYPHLGLNWGKIKPKLGLIWMRCKLWNISRVKVNISLNVIGYLLGIQCYKIKFNTWFYRYPGYPSIDIITRKKTSRIIL